VALAALWSFATISLVSASTMPPPDEPQTDAAAPTEPSEATAPPATSSEALAVPSDQDGKVVEEMPNESTANHLAPPASVGGLQIPIEGIRRSTDVVGEVVGHPTGKVLMAAHDVVTLKLDRSAEVKPHTLYAIARREQFVEHPDSGHNRGYVVRVVATVEMEEVFGRYWSGRIISSTDYVTLDDWVIPFEAAVQETGGAPPDLAGLIVAVRDDLVLASAASVVYTDLGSNNGVKSGDEFSIIRPGAGGRRGGPDRLVGVLRILAVQPSSSSAYLTATTEPVMIGDRLEHVLTSSAVQ
jgi:hypothetical protein